MVKIGRVRIPALGLEDLHQALRFGVHRCRLETLGRLCLHVVQIDGYRCGLCLAGGHFDQVRAFHAFRVALLDGHETGMRAVAECGFEGMRWLLLLLQWVWWSRWTFSGRRTSMMIHGSKAYSRSAGSMPVLPMHLFGSL